MYRNHFGLATLLLSVLGSPLAAHAQGILINLEPNQRVALPRPILVAGAQVPASTYKIKELTVNCRLVDQIARTQVSQSFVNTGSTVMEVCFVFPLPYDGAIDQLTLLVDGQEFPAKLLPAAEARQVYESIVRKNKDPALLEWIGTGMFRTSVFPVPPGAERKVTLRYSQLCRQDHGLTDFLFPLSTAKYTSHPVEKLDIQVTIESNVGIKNVYSPTHAVDIRRPDDKHATVNYTVKDQIPGADFRLLYDVGKGEIGTSVLSYRPDKNEDGYFLLLTSPQIKAADARRPSSTVVFVVDRSGSMTGQKLTQAKGALKFVLNNLQEGDLFNIVSFDSQVESFRPELQKFDDDTRKAALGYAESLFAGGSTNISGALKTALAQVQDSNRPTFVIFLTDGLPTHGETAEAKIVAATQTDNRVRARLFVFGVGYDVNSRLLDKLARLNFGQSEYVRPNEDIEARVSALYSRIGSPIMTDLTIRFDVEGAAIERGQPVNRTYPAATHDLFAGEQLVLVGRYKIPGVARVLISGRVGDRDEKFEFPATLVEQSNDETSGFIAKLWAVRRVGEIIDAIDLNGKNDELTTELVQLATKHGIMTPYTSFLADDQADRHNLAGNASRAQRELRALDQTSGQQAFDQRAKKGTLQKAQRAAEATEDFGLNQAGLAADPAAAPPAPSAKAYSAQDAGARRRSGPRSQGESAARNPGESTIQHIGRKTFYRQGDGWVDADVTKEQQQAVTKIERFGREYFELIHQHGDEVAKYLNFDEPVTVEIAGQAYSF